ncbi:hypothetical protein SAMN02927916_3355 [Flavobacterium anhuiense]|uniref:Uncharacterized protein n=1 Tax=Flavobacterium anhuiense TaxID=459526 RepID=A0ABY0LY34_9FLAO|nr:tail fiber protein [Flavobacterium anhuiense]SCY78161.1 hypothetical protein SAMN02927916_3355 [Flavobacterium anhuiense]
MKLKKYAIITILLFASALSNAQNDINQNGLKTSVITNLSAVDTQARRYEIATIGYNSYHWQTGGLLIIELFQTSFGTGYEKYIVENGFLQGANIGSPIVKLVESHGIYHSGKISLGTPIDLTSTLGDKINRKLPVYFDVRDYATYRVKITYLQEKVDTITYANQIKIDQTPVGVNISDFSAPIAFDYDLRLNGLGGNHYILNGNLGIGTTNPTSKLTVAGNIASREVKVTVNAGADFVFEKDYNLPSLESIDKFIKENKHLPEIASAEEMKKDGINLSEMNIKLLQKIEELTLYIIEQERKNNDQSKKIEKLEQENETFKLLSERISKLENKSK